MNGQELAYDRAAIDPAVVLIHAGIADRRMWRAQQLALADRFALLMPDLRGFGDSPPASGPYDHAGDVLTCMTATGIERATVIGVSMGGEVAVDVALAATRAGSAEPSHPLLEAWETSDAAFEAGDIERAVAVEVATPVLGAGRSAAQVDPAYLERAGGGLEVGEPIPPATPRFERLGELAPPALLVMGDRDLPDIAASMDRLVAEIPGAQRAPTIPDCAHLPPLERPEAFNRLLLGFLGE